MDLAGRWVPKNRLPSTPPIQWLIISFRHAQNNPKKNISLVIFPMISPLSPYAWIIYIYIYMQHIICISNIYHVIGSYPLISLFIIEGSLEVKLPTIWTVEKQR